MKDLLQAAPDSQMDISLKNSISKWSETPKSIEVLETLDHCVRYSSGSDFVVKVLNIILDQAIKSENTDYDAVVSKATWRQEWNG
jgi:hypothetical protein